MAAALCNGKEAQVTPLFIYFQSIELLRMCRLHCPRQPRSSVLTGDFESVVLLFTPGDILMAYSGGHMPSLQVIVHCVRCSAVMDSLSMRQPCLLSEHVLNNGFYFSASAGWPRR